jgi:hypothetical protein
MARHKVRSQGKVVERCRVMRGDLENALGRVPDQPSDPAVVDAVWRGEALGTLLWSLQLAELPAYDHPFNPEAVAALDPAAGTMRDAEDIELERDSARLWLWRARTADLQASGELELPVRYATFDQLIAATAMRGYEQGILPSPMRGDFHAYGKVYRHLTPGQQLEAHSIAVERYHALNWLCGEGTTWNDVPLDT